ncbi:armadillo-type protein [Endogone sp. FLAS-F59071]|nr:armadillo-type protein [Endogone sp. FLAS-F59071]|eukprot:RUS22624.1 armadillo-type protein [Endogone sp. FLAS-F59071]
MPSVSASVPNTRPEVIQSLIDGVDRYNPENVSILEEYLAAQCHTEDYDLMANLAILKLYQFNLQLTRERVILNILVKALTAIPEPDFNLCLYLLTEQMVADEPIQKLMILQQLLEEARYKKFWEVYESDGLYNELTSEVEGFTGAIRKVIANVVNMTYQTISSDLLKSYLNLDGETYQSFLSSYGWSDVEGVVTIPVNKHNEAKTVVIRENIKFEQLTKVIGYSNEL